MVEIFSQAIAALSAAATRTEKNVVVGSYFNLAKINYPHAFVAKELHSARPTSYPGFPWLLLLLLLLVAGFSRCMFAALGQTNECLPKVEVQCRNRTCAIETCITTCLTISCSVAFSFDVQLVTHVPSCGWIPFSTLST